MYRVCAISADSTNLIEFTDRPIITSIMSAVTSTVAGTTTTSVGSHPQIFAIVQKFDKHGNTESIGKIDPTKLDGAPQIFAIVPRITKAESMPKLVDKIMPSSTTIHASPSVLAPLPPLTSTVTAKTVTIEKFSQQKLNVFEQQQQQQPQQQLQHKQRKKSNKQPMGKLVNMVVCSCGKRFEYIWSLTYHKKWECGQDLKCEYCNDVFTDISFLILRRHREECLKRL